MPFVHANGIRQYYRLDGREDKPVVILSHSLGCDHTMWDQQAAALVPHFRVLRYDTRGHGGTEVTAGDYSIELLARDALALADALGIGQFAWCGLSLGGMIGQWVAANAGPRVTALVLANTSSRFPDPAPMETRRRTVLEKGMAAVEETVMSRFFLPETLRENPPAVASERRVLLATDPVGYAGCCAAVRDMRQTELLDAIGARTLVIIGSRDQSTPLDPHGETLVRGVREAEVKTFPTAHISAIERPRAFNAALLGFLLPRGADVLADGFRRRREVLGKAHVDRAMANMTAFTEAFQELITRYAWGTIWSDASLDDRTRRLLALTATAALGRWEEFRMHVRTGLAHGVEATDIEQTLLQLAIYAGVPVANTGFHIASEELAEAAKAE